jgi:H+-translocating NAD(P) transhydrogenase subunit alpha
LKDKTSQGAFYTSCEERINQTMSPDLLTRLDAFPLLAVAESAPKTDFLTLLFVLMLATFTGLLVIRNVSRLLHTPLMSLTNAISAIAVVGSIVLAGRQETTFSTILGAVAVAASMTNIVSGFLLTDRMLKMFKKRENSKS